MNDKILRDMAEQFRPDPSVRADLLARIVQHETDHLDGVMYFQRMEPAARREVMAGIRGSGWFNR